jgi:hypothetical protein
MNRRARLAAALAVSFVLFAAQRARSQDDTDISRTPKDDEPDQRPTEQSAPATPKVADEERTPALNDHTTTRASTEIAGYTDTDHVTVFTPSIGAGIENATSGAAFHAHYLVDVVSAASVDIVSTASRKWTEVRQAGAIDGTYKPHDFGIQVTGSASVEPDYTALGGSATLSQDFNDKNLTLLFGYGYGHDTIGRGGTSFTIFSRTLDRNTLMGGVTAVIDKSTSFAASWDLIIESGDQSKPYRYIPMFTYADAIKMPAGASVDYVNAHRLPERPLEQLPLSRHRVALTGRLSHRFSGSTLRVDERLYDDTWALKASTTDARFIVDLSRRIEAWPHLRFHTQSAVDFWQRAYISAGAPGWNLPEFRTGDRELGPLRTFTVGGGAHWFIGPEHDLRAWTVGVVGDLMYTSYLDDLYLTDRTAVLGAITLEAAL